MKDEALERVHEILDRGDVLARRFVAFVARPWSVRELFWAHRRKLWNDFWKWHALLGKHERELFLFAEATEAFPDLARRTAYSPPVRMGYGALSLTGPVLSVEIEEGFQELRPLLSWLQRRGYTLKKYDDKLRYLRRYKLLDDDGKVAGYVMAHVGSGAKCDVIERKVETTEYEIVCEGEAEIRGTP